MPPCLSAFIEFRRLHRRGDGARNDRRRWRTIGKVLRDPMPCLTSAAYHMGDYFLHWIKMPRSLTVTPIFHVIVPQGCEGGGGKKIHLPLQRNMRVLNVSWTCARRAHAHRTSHAGAPLRDMEWKASISPRENSKPAGLHNPLGATKSSNTGALHPPPRPSPQRMVTDRELLIVVC